MASGLDDAITAAMGVLDPDEADTELETTDEVEESTDEQPDDDLEAIEAAVEDSEDEGDDDDLADDESDEDVDDESDDEDEDNPDDGVLTLTDEAQVTLPDGTTLTGKELREGYLRQSDYTRKTQEIAEQRKAFDEQWGQVEEWFEQRAENPAAWAWEVVSEYGEDPAATLAGAIGQAPDPDGVLAWTIRKLAESGRLGDEFVRLVGLDEVAGKASEYERDERVRKLERQHERQQREQQTAEQQRAEQARRAELVERVENAWTAVKESQGLNFDSEQDDTAAKVALLRFAHENGVGNLETAYAAMAHQGIAPKGTPTPSTEDTTDPAADEAEVEKALERKRKTRAITRRPSGGSAAKPARRGLDDALEDAIKDTGLKF